MRIVVFGGSGFLGSHVVDKLVSDGHEVTNFDCVLSRYQTSNFETVIGSILDLPSVNSILEGVDAIYHFAGIADIGTANSDPLKAMAVNTLGTLNLLEACKTNSVSKFIFASSLYVHSREGGIYRCSKMAAEELIYEYNQQHGLDYVVLHYGSLYGPRSGLENGLHRIVEEAMRTGRVRYSGHRDTLREYIFVEDAAESTVKMLDPFFSNSCITIAGSQSQRIADVLGIIAETIGITREVEFTEQYYAGHYVRTPYALRRPASRKYTPPLQTDFAHGILKLVEQFDTEPQQG